MLGSIDESGTAGGEVLPYLNRNRRSLAGAKIVAPDIASLFKNDRVFSNRGEFNVEIFEVGELFRFLAGEVD